MKSFTPGINPVLQHMNIKNKTNEMIYSGSASVLILETRCHRGKTEFMSPLINREEFQLSFQLKKNGTFLSFMEECLWAIHQLEPDFPLTITDIWMMKNEARAMEEIVTAFNKTLTSLKKSLLLYIEGLEHHPDPELLQFFSLWATSFPKQHLLVLNGLTLPSNLSQTSSVSVQQLEEKQVEEMDWSDVSSQPDDASGVEHSLHFGNTALHNGDLEHLKQTFIEGHSSIIDAGRVWSMHAWVAFIEKNSSGLEPEADAAMAVCFLETAQYEKAADYVERALKKAEPYSSGYFKAMLTKARLLRQTESSDASNDLLDPMIFELEDLSTEKAYVLLSEKITNLMLENNWVKVDELVRNLLTICDIAQNDRTKSWYERALVPICYHYGDLPAAIQFYEHSLCLSMEDQAAVQRQSTSTYAARAYFAMGETEKAITLMEKAVHSLKKHGRIQDLQSHYQTLAVLYYWESFKHEGKNKETFIQRSAEMMDLFRAYGQLICPSLENLKTIDHYQVIYSILAGTASTVEKQRAFSLMKQSSSPLYLKTLNVLSFDSLRNKNFHQGLSYALYAIEVGESSKQKVQTAIAYGLAAYAAIHHSYNDRADFLVRRFLRVCTQSNYRLLFNAPALIEPILHFSEEKGIEPELQQSIRAYADSQK